MDGKFGGVKTVTAQQSRLDIKYAISLPMDIVCKDRIPETDILRLPRGSLMNRETKNIEHTLVSH